MFKENFQERSETRIEAIMAIVDEMYSEKDTLKTEIEINTVAIVHANGSNWGIVDWWGNHLSPWFSSPNPGNDLSKIAVESNHVANLYVFITGKESISGLGLAKLDSVCDTSRERRVSVNKYAAGDIKGGDAYTAEVYFS